MADALPTAVILAGGLARRMGGGDKPLRAVAGRPLLARVIERLQPQCRALALNANGDPARFAPFGLPVIADSVQGFPGPLAGVLAALDWAAAQQSDATCVLTAPGDCPFLPHDLVARLNEARLAEAAEIAVAASGGHLHPVIALWPVALRDALRTALFEDDIRKVERFTARYPRAVVEWPVTPFDPFFNANTPEDVAEAERIAAGDQ
ncbi:molybdenum cofactor guanylyltransferase MobA [Rhodopseudomonas palustris]|uniref:Molybdenum cofactor guanylyltransferase n=1 Tax=Rhodopseudomonas palustris (strain ATCC BAA-98 / CGA009) TaxID=258594 RepID=Q6N3N9_RHOPA|nr:molybdenum cofactor guanylyltransferase MobA [Rhodopseudomonas palustris]OPF95199.1 molybdenum cofactor guanylyltransferase [Rhodopseudomonas palustris]PPQ42388.1 molybdenum cofactor guanylyltransferase MobA [Rhodopseudomonas palustris]QQM05204.1 Molybdenum cofactor guanylyltransferase [Rhodopseudomonas palustris]RJF65556.1 molybdenum cofactor guanylyltransferase MobA [Rhodopseudomonas palustris]WAB76552.1 molybdenum cofactor guanylyltransferase MobA [Rhodopseudomonas palustris]